MILVGIDFSLNSPSICINANNQNLKFISFFNDEGKDYLSGKTKKYELHRELHDNNLVEMVSYTRYIDKSSYVSEQKTKMYDAIQLAKLIVDYLRKYKDDDIRIGIEGFSYQSSGQAFIDLIIYNSFLRKELVDTFGYNNISIISPTEGKKIFSGKGNANKEVMINAFLTNYVNSELISNSPLYIFYKNKQLDFKNIKPLDDLVDSCGIMYSLSKLIYN